MSAQSISGSWSYRSLINDPNPFGKVMFYPQPPAPDAPKPTTEDAEKLAAAKKAAMDKAFDLVWADGKAELREADDGTVEGELELLPDRGVGLNLTGSVERTSDNGPTTLRLDATGRPGTPTAGAKYSLVGWGVETWPDGADQAATIVGSLINLGEGDPQPVGTVGSFMLVG